MIISINILHSNDKYYLYKMNNLVNKITNDYLNLKIKYDNLKKKILIYEKSLIKNKDIYVSVVDDRNNIYNENLKLRKTLNKIKNPFLQYESKKKMLYKLQNGRCKYCDRKIQEQHMTIEHLILKSLGGNKHYGNICLTCKKCNQNRSNHMSHRGALSEILKRLNNPLWFCKDIFNEKSQVAENDSKNNGYTLKNFQVDMERLGGMIENFYKSNNEDSEELEINTDESSDEIDNFWKALEKEAKKQLGYERSNEEVDKKESETLLSKK